MLENEFDGKKRKFHIYRLFNNINSFEPQIEIQYIIIGKYHNKKYEFHKSIINVIKKSDENNIGIRRMVLQQKPKSPIKLKSIRNEIVKDYFHSISDFALIKYDEREKEKERQYYFYNQNLDYKTHLELGEYELREGHYEVSTKARNILIKSNENYDEGTNFSRYVNQGIPIQLFEQHYHQDLNEPIPLWDDFNY